MGLIISTTNVNNPSPRSGITNRETKLFIVVSLPRSAEYGSETWWDSPKPKIRTSQK